MYVRMCQEQSMSVRTYVSGAEHECTYVCNNVRMCQEQSMSVRTYVVTYVCVGSRAMSVRTQLVYLI